MEEKPNKIAVIGTGLAGLTAAYLLQRLGPLTLFEKGPSAGGHATTVTLENGPDKGMTVDMGLSLFTEKGSPVLQKLLSHLRVTLKDTQLSFGYHDERSRLQYAGTGPNGLFAQRGNLFKPSFWAMTSRMTSFFDGAQADLRSGKLSGKTLGEYLEAKKVPQDFLRDHLFPLGAAFWLVSPKDLPDFSAEAFVSFFAQNGLKGLSGPSRFWMVEGGTQALVRALLKGFKGRVKTSSGVESVERRPDGVLVRAKDGQEYAFDKVVLAVHADEVLPMLLEPTEEETRLFSPWRYAKNFAVLHTDTDVMPSLRRSWASWTYLREMDATLQEPAAVTWHVNRLQGLHIRDEYFVTFNRVRPIPVHHVLKEMYFTHPILTREAVDTQKDLPKLNAQGPLYFCGSYFGRGFHEDAVKSALEIGRCFGQEL